MIASLIALKFFIFSNPKFSSVPYLFQESREYQILNKTSDRQYFFASLIDDVEKKVDEEKAKTEFVDDDIEEIIGINRWEFMLVIPVFLWVIYKSLNASNDD